MVCPGNVATPPIAATVVLLADSEPLPGLVPMASLIALVAVVIVFPNASCTVTATAVGLIAPPAVVLVGWTEKANLLAAAGVTLKAVLVAAVRPLAVATMVYPVPALMIVKFGKVATPLTVGTVVVPNSVPLAGLVP